MKPSPFKAALSLATVQATRDAVFHMHVDPLTASRAAATLPLFARVGGLDTASRVASILNDSFTPPIPRAYPPAWPAHTQQTIAKVYASLFGQGLTMAKTWRLSPKPGRSMAEQAQARIECMHPGPIRDFFLSVAELKNLNHTLTPLAARGADAWLSKGIGKQDLAALANIVERLEELHPGEGVAKALAWMRQHPDVQSEFEFEAVTAPAPPKTSGRPNRL